MTSSVSAPRVRDRGRAVLVGPCTVRSSHSSQAEHSERVTQALATIDDELALVEGRPVAVAALWRDVLSSATAGCGSLLVCPSWWSDKRVETVLAAARELTSDVEVAGRAALLAQSCSRTPAVVVEIAESFVALSRPPDGRPACVVPRDGDPAAVADEVVRLTTGRSVVIDRAEGVGGAADLGAMIMARLRFRGCTVTVVDDDRLLRAAALCAPCADDPPPAGARKALGTRRRPRQWIAVVVGVVVTCVLVAAVRAVGGPEPSTPRMTLLIEGRVVVEMPADWPVRRVTMGPGSARLQVSSPANLHAAVHVTQSPVPNDETLQRTADTLRRALQIQPPGVFVDFNPDDRRGARPAVTYREIRNGHDIRWTVLLDRDARISVGCQSAPGSESTVQQVCEHAISSARNISEFAGTVAAQP